MNRELNISFQKYRIIQKEYTVFFIRNSKKVQAKKG